MEPNGHNPTVKGSAPGKLIMTIEMDQSTGQIMVSALPSHPVFAYGMLEAGRQILQKVYEEQGKNNRIVPASAMPQLVRH